MTNPSVSVAVYEEPYENGDMSIDTDVPVAIVPSRYGYGGNRDTAYGGSWVAIKNPGYFVDLGPEAEDDVEDDATRLEYVTENLWSGDIDAATWWENTGHKLSWLGVGETPDDALNDLSVTRTTEAINAAHEAHGVPPTTGPEELLSIIRTVRPTTIEAGDLKDFQEVSRYVDDTGNTIVVLRKP